MATQKQIAANRRNAQLSTGPRSTSGKALTRFNALKHGLDAKALILPSENQETFEQLSAEYHERFDPRSPEERALVDRAIGAEPLL